MGNSGSACFCWRDTNTIENNANASSSSSSEDDVVKCMEFIKELEEKMKSGEFQPSTLTERITLSIHNAISSLQQPKQPVEAKIIQGNKMEGSWNKTTTLASKVINPILKKWKELNDTGLPKQVADAMSKGLQSVGQSNFILLGFAFLSGMLDRAIKISENSEAIIHLLRDLETLMPIINRFVGLENDPGHKIIQDSTLKHLIQAIVECLIVCQGYIEAGSPRKFLFGDSYEEELNGVSQSLKWAVELLNADGVGGLAQGLERQTTIRPTLPPQNNILEVESAGIDQSVIQVKEMLQIDNDVKGIAAVLVGHGGIGKSTLANTVISQLDLKGFKYCRVWFDNSRKSNEINRHITELQAQIVYDISKQKMSIPDTKVGQQEVRKVLESHTCFLFIDNVEDKRHVHKLLPSHLRLENKRLRILITSRDFAVTEVEPLVGNDDLIAIRYPVKPLAASHSFSVLKNIICRHAEGQVFVEEFQGELGLIQDIANACGGIPILLTVLGGHLNLHRRQKCYEVVLQDLRAGNLEAYDAESPNLHERIHDTLLSCYRRLDARLKEAFLDVCVFFYGARWSEAKNVIGPDWMEILESNMLIRKETSSCTRDLFDIVDDVDLMFKRGTSSEQGGYVMIHDLLRAMGVNEARQRGNRLAIYSQEEWSDFEHSEDFHKRLCKMEGLFIRRPIEADIDLGRMSRSIRILHIHDPEGKVTFKHQGEPFKKLKYLRLISAHSLFSIFYNEACNIMPTLEVFNMSRSKDLEALPNGFGSLKSLKIVNLSRCEKLTRLSNEISGLESLKYLDLGGCRSLKSLPLDFGKLHSLETLKMEGCESLETKQKDFENLKSLKYLDLGGFTELQCSTIDFEGCRFLEELFMEGCEIRELPKGFGNLKSLKCVDLGKCSLLESLPSDFGQLVSLEELTMEYCRNLARLPEEFTCLESLRYLDLDECQSLTHLPSNFGKLTSLEKLFLCECRSLEKLPDDFSGLKSLKYLSLQGCESLKHLPSDFGKLTSLEELDISPSIGYLSYETFVGSNELAELPYDFVNLKSLKKLNLENCKNIKCLPPGFGRLLSLEELTMEGCEALVSLPDDFASLISLRKLNLSGCKNLQCLPSNIQSLSSLEELNVANCESLNALPDDFTRLKSLNKLDINYCTKIEYLPSNFGALSLLEELNMANCESLNALPNDFPFLQSLKKLDISYCRNLAPLPVNFGSLSSLEELSMVSYESLVSLPDDFASLKSLKKLDISYCKNLDCSSLKKLDGSSLEVLVMKGCENLTVLTFELTSLNFLKELNLENCIRLESLPSGIKQHTSLRSLNIKGCKKLERQSLELENMNSLDHLEMPDGRVAKDVSVGEIMKAISEMFSTDA